MLYRIYYMFSRIFYSLYLKKIGKNVQLRFGGRVIHGEYVEMEENVTISENWLIAVYPEFAGQDNPVKTNGNGVHLDTGVTVNRNLTIYCANKVEIGANCLLGSNILITDNDHGMNPELGSYKDQPLIIKDTVIEEECWIAQNCCILAGSHIGNHSVIGAGSIVKGVIPPYSIAVGSPARVVRRWDFEEHKWKKENV